MKSTIFAISFLALTAIVSANHCTLTCTQDSGNWTGNTSVAIEVDKNVEILYDVQYKIFVVINTQQNLVFATNGKFFLILNIETGGYLLIDVKTQYAVYGKITIDFRGSNGTIDRTKLIITLNRLLVKYQSITSSTSSSFNFGLLIISFYSFQYDISIIYKGQTELIEALNASFSAWFILIRQQITSGAIQSGSCIYGFFAVIMEIEIEIAIAIFNVIRISIERYVTFQIELIIEVVRIIRTDIRKIILFSQKVTDIITTGANLSIKAIIEWANNASNNPVLISFTAGGSTYTFSVIKIDSQYVIRFTLKSSNGRTMDIKILYVQGVLVIINQQTGIVVALFNRSFVVLNTTSEYALVGTWRLVGGVRGKIVKAVQVSLHIRNQQYSKVGAEIKALIKKHGDSLTFSFAKLYSACISGSITQIRAVVGSRYANIVLVYYAGFFAQSANGASFGGIIVGVFGNRSSTIVTYFFVTAINGVVAFNGNWFIIIQAIISGSPPSIKTSTSTYTSKYSYAYTIRGK